MKNKLDSGYEKIQTVTRNPRHFARESWQQALKSDLYQRQVGFTCLHCQYAVPSQNLYSGVQNRNHCPYCLWSRHVDLYQAGDRLNACREGMQPIGVTFKRQRNKYGPVEGELMLIHHCSGCGGLSINRIAADDDRDGIVQVLEAYAQMGAHIHQKIRTAGIVAAEMSQREQVLISLFGKGYAS